MHSRFDSLLRRCKARKRKTLLKRIGIFTALLLFAAGAAYIAGSGVSLFGIGEKPIEQASFQKSGHQPLPEVKGAAAEPKQVSKAPKSRQEAFETPKAEPKAEPKPEPISKPKAPVLAESISQKKIQTPKKRSESVATAEAKKLPEPENEKPKEQIVETAEQKRGVEAKPKVVLEVKEVTDLDALMERYGNSPRYSTALKIAEAYYEKGDFDNASLWAKKANLLDRDDERAWIIYAESEYALGREERAKRILRLFLDYKDSVKARSLLMTWSRP